METQQHFKFKAHFERLVCTGFLKSEHRVWREHSIISSTQAHVLGFCLAATAAVLRSEKLQTLSFLDLTYSGTAIRDKWGNKQFNHKMMKKLPALCQALTCASWWSLLGTESCLLLLEGWKFPSNTFMTIAIPIDQRFSCPQHLPRKTPGNPSQPQFWYTYSFHLPSEDNLQFGDFPHWARSPI